MGGKTKQSQRTKNNVRPSSSGRSAELLNNAARLDPGGMSTGSGRMMPVLFPTLATTLDPSLNPDFALCLKKLNKKDPITKTKALQELSELVRSGDVEDVAAALPSWALAYRALVADPDHKVREAAQTTMGAVARRLGRRLAPQLRALLAPWLQAQYDEYAPAAAAARASLAATFPESKLPDVISFCMVEVAASLLENLVGNADAALGNRVCTAEEREAQRARQAAASLQGLEYFVLQLPAQHGAWLWAQLAPMLQAPSFWKMASHKSQQVRASWYGALGRIIERYGDTFGDAHGQRAARLLLAAPAPRAQLWACLLLLMRHVKADVWLDKKDLLVKKIIDVLENGGWGDAKHLSSMLLPLLAYMPPHLLTEEFSRAFFAAVFKGLEQRSVMCSKSERQAWVSSAAECLRHVSRQPAAWACAVAGAALRDWLRLALSLDLDAPTSTNLVKHSGACMAALVKCWLTRAARGGEAGAAADRLVETFWRTVAATARAQIDEVPPADRNDITAYIESHILLLQTLKYSFAQETKKPKSIKFDDERPEAAAESAETAQECDAAVAERYDRDLDDVAEKICAQYFEFAAKHHIADIVFCPLLTLLINFDGRDFFAALARGYGADSIYGFYDKVLREWLAGDTMRCKSVVDIVFLLLKHLPEDEQDALLDSFDQLGAEVTEWAVRLALAHPHCALPAARRWLRAPPARACALRAAATLLQHDCPRARALLLAGLAADDRGEMMISLETVREIVEMMSGALAPESAQAPRLAQLAAALAGELAGVLDCSRLALALFRLQLHIPLGGALGAGAWREVREAWQDAGCARAAAVAAAHQHLHTADTLDIPKIEHVASLCPYLLPDFGESQIPADVADVADLLRQVFDFQNDCLIPIEVCALRLDCVHSRLNCPLDDTPAMRAVAGAAQAPELTAPQLAAFLTRLLLRAALLRTLALHRAEDDRAWGDLLLRNDYIEEELANVLHDYAVLCSIVDGYAFWAGHAQASAGARHARCALDALVSELGGDGRRGLRARMARAAGARGYYWSRARVLLDALLRAPQDQDPPAAVPDLRDVVTGNGYFHTLQCSASGSSARLAALRAAREVMLRSVYLAHAHEPRVLDAAFVADAAAGAASDPSVIVNAYFRHQHIMLSDSDVGAATWRHVVSNAAVARYLAQLVADGGWHAAEPAWDFTTISTCSLLGALCNARAHWAAPKVAMLLLAVLELYWAVRQFVRAVPARSEQSVPAPHVQQLPVEWRDIFAPDIAYSLCSIILTVLEHAEARPTSTACAVLGALQRVARELDWHSLARQHQTGALSLEALLGAGARALAAPAHHGYKYLAHALLAGLARPVVLHDAERLAACSGSEEGAAQAQAPRPALAALLPALERLQDLLHAALLPFKVGEDTCEMVPYTDAHGVALGCLLLADAYYGACQLARGDLVHHYLELGRETKHAELLLTAALRLLPAAVAAHAQDADAAPAPQHYTPMFLEPPVFSLDEPSSGADVARLACRALAHVARWAGGAARGWWGAAGARARAALERVLRAHVSPALVRAQLQAAAGPPPPGARVQVLASTREVVVTFEVEERELELRVALGAAHPLQLPRVSVPAAPAQQPLLSTHWLVVYLAYQNGTVGAALRMWVDGVARRVQAAPQCYICYCRLHPASARLPKVVCHQCRNKFHAECLRKWFTTSSKSNCPLCRANF